MKIMIVDDSKVIGQGLERLLNDIEGIEITCIAKDGQQAIEEFSKSDPDIVILDLMLPQKNGIEVLKNIRTNNDKVIVIILTNYNQSYFRNLCTVLGADYFLDKSAEFNKVYQICSNMINPDSEHDTDYLLLNNHKRNSYVWCK